MNRLFLLIAVAAGGFGIAIVTVFFGPTGALNFLLAFGASAMISYASYAAYRRLVQAQAGKEEPPQDDEEDGEDEEPKPTKTKVLGQTYRGFLSPLRLVAYAVLVGSFISLQTRDSLVLLPFFLGLAVVPLSALLFAFFYGKDHAAK